VEYASEEAYLLLVQGFVEVPELGFEIEVNNILSSIL